MSARSVKILAIAVLLLFGLMYVLNTGDRNRSAPGEALLLPELEDRLNNLEMVMITDARGTMTLERESADGRWIVAGKGGYPADTATLREVLLALADARKLEPKTSNPELYERLGVADPRGEDSAQGSGVLVIARGDDYSVALIVGDTAQQGYRYARIPEQAQSWLIDQDPDLPDGVGGWLLPEIVDIDTARIRSVEIRHQDGEVIRIRKEDADDRNFEVENIPENRELSHETVANSIAGAVNDMDLEDVTARDRLPDETSANVAVETFDGLRLQLSVYPAAAADGESGSGEDGDTQRWITLQASVARSAPGEDSGQPAGDDPQTADGASDATQAAGDPAAEAERINARVAGWAYRIPDYKLDQLTRRWENLLREE